MTPIPPLFKTRIDAIAFCFFFFHSFPLFSSKFLPLSSFLSPFVMSVNLGNTKGSAGSESTDQENGVSKVARPSPKGRKRKSKLKQDELSVSEVTVPRHTRRRGHVRGSRSNSGRITTERGKLDTGRFHHYLMHMWDEFPKEKVESATYFDPLWFDMYANQNRKANVLSWIKEKGIFSKKYVLVPIVMWSHWSLLIFCNLGQRLDSETNAPCMLLLDSLQAVDSKRLEPSIRRLLIDIYMSEERTESEKELLKIPLSIPDVPQQKRGDDCGFYVLYYIRLFIDSPLQRFTISEGYPKLMGKDWFTDEEVESFCKSLEALPAVSDHGPASSESSDSIEMAETPFS
ncbi:ubiquitin-like-specific protease 2 isoform X2 [Salvia miltiorrhiza]|uniref:ubiquitin-like-specific protease 2 isoform X2 n=1 Tax=Salvia miltiorrhiza TaxID=226208 RepID=UPI0025AD6155|nr:ubiquitin-like-specific protease 2 isoform X2 [Salvia miltiorrhiza]